jgi:hypothetical protein
MGFLTAMLLGLALLQIQVLVAAQQQQQQPPRSSYFDQQQRETFENNK